MTARQIAKLAGGLAAILLLLLVGSAFYGGFSQRPLTEVWLPGFAATFFLIIIASVLQNATEGANAITEAYPRAGQCADSGCLPDPRSVEAILTPSEVVYLAGDQFIDATSGFVRYRLAGSGAGVSKRGLAQQVYAAAFLAAEKAGTLRLEVRSTESLLGLRTNRSLHVMPGDRPACFPANSLESRFCRAGRPSGGRVYRMVADLFEKSADPFARANHLVGAILADRGLLQISRAKWLHLFTIAEIQVPQRTAALVAVRTSEIESLLDECRQTRPEVWKMLIEGISKGISSRENDDPGTSWM